MNYSVIFSSVELGKSFEKPTGEEFKAIFKVAYDKLLDRLKEKVTGKFEIIGHDIAEVRGYLVVSFLVRQD